ncbi:MULTISPECIES: aspartate carbamoyltransferase regulatory subunit [Muribaculum]|jgi:aspartate carbamoyltransferase regulatory subunit|uniref:Aspartate carbamoyltransferase regulatory subunit n=1 Tax=Muribaculum caecicola TaxID=3038144 RepID=A0AC61S8R5_9BACT|nr:MULTISPECIES: aspartate carbamoyltransferase regulatory subunit [Muribaculum]THG55132.1 aspartate carbamoyltransferase regulatory subunit [Muribaculum caecicola]
MKAANKELAVAALQNGTVIDRIPSSALFKAVAILGIEKIDKHVTIGNNLDSKKLGTKGIIKVADTFFPEDVINRIALIAPTAKINIIRNFEVVEKLNVSIPENIIGIVKCDNPKCITNNEPMATNFHLIDADRHILRCHYCGHSVSAKNAHIK